MTRHALVVGSGVIGLTAGIELLRAGWNVTLRARERWARTTSAVAGAVWFPYAVAPWARVRGWAARSYLRYAELAQVAGSGVRLTPARIYTRPASGNAWWRELVPDWRELPAQALPPGITGGDELLLPVAEMTRFLPWLEQEFVRLGGKLEQREVTDLDTAVREAGTVVCCAGLGARELARDPRVFPRRGQVLRVPALVQHSVLDDDHPDGVTYVVARSGDCILGGSSDVSESLAPNDATSRGILQRCAGLEPSLADAGVLEVRVGLRPARDEVRLEREPRPAGVVIHDYGHGGAGMTLAWGCAEEVVQLLGG